MPETLAKTACVLLFLIATMQPVQATDGPTFANCLAAAHRILLDFTLTPESAVLLERLAAESRCKSESFQTTERFRKMADVLIGLSTGKVPATLQEPLVADLPSSDPLLDVCPTTVMAGTIELEVVLAGTHVILNRQFAAGTASHTGPVLPTDTADMSVAGSQAYGLEGTDTVFGGAGFIKIAGTLIPAGRFSASVSCGAVVDAGPAGSFLQQACGVSAKAKLIDWSGSGVTEPFQIIVSSNGRSVIPCDIESEATMHLPGLTFRYAA